MKKTIKLTEGQLNNIIKRIVSEQGIKYSTGLSNDPDVIGVYSIFLKYIIHKTNATDNTTYAVMLDKIKKITDNELGADIFKYFKNNGYKKGDMRISKFQNILSTKNFLNKDDKTSDFVDGDFGVATARAAINYRIKTIEDVIRKKGMSYTLGTNKEISSSTKEAGQEIFKSNAPSDTSNISIDVGTQSRKP